MSLICITLLCLTALKNACERIVQVLLCCCVPRGKVFLTCDFDKAAYAGTFRTVWFQILLAYID